MRLAALALALLLTAGCDGPAPRAGGTLEIVALAGPTCPVETDPPDPNCAPRAVVGAEILVTPAGGGSVAVAHGQTDADGRLTLQVPPGEYVLSASAVEGLMAGPEPVMVSVAEGRTIEVELAYDTGIR